MKFVEIAPVSSSAIMVAVEAMRTVPSAPRHFPINVIFILLIICFLFLTAAPRSCPSMSGVRWLMVNRLNDFGADQPRDGKSKES
jgi:hypothetical protein